MKKKTIALVLACILCVAIGIGGTLAWLTANSTPVVNTFTTSDIDIKLEETTGNSYKMVPGHTITKNPKVTVKAGSEPCYLFAKVEKSTDPAFDNFMTYEMAEGWTLVDGETNVYCREVKNTETDKEKDVLATNATFYVIKDNTIAVKDTVTKEQMKALTTNPSLTITAYATQLYQSNNMKFSVTDAWNAVKPSAPTT